MKVSPEMEAKILELAGVAPKAPPVTQKPRAKAGKPDVKTSAPARWCITLWPACRVVSEANTRSHWAARAKRFKKQADALRAVMLDARIAEPGIGTVHMPAWPVRCVVTLTHVGPRMDDDNLAGAFKGIRDALAAAMGIDDADIRVQWKYDQRTGKPGVEITIEWGN